MTKQYTYFGQHFDNVLVSGYENGKKFNRKFKYEPYLFARGSSDWQTVEGKSVKPIHFDTISKARKFLRDADETGEMVWGSRLFYYTHIFEEYTDLVSDASQFKVLNFDIETDSENGFGDSQKADREITSITLKLFRHPDTYVIGTKDYEVQDAELKQLIADGKIKIRYLKVDNEAQLLEAVIRIVNHLQPDVFTGWNIGLFDVQYICKRIAIVLGKEHMKKLSPFGLINETEVTVFNKPHDKYEVVGIPTVDYMDTFKKFSFKNYESFKLDYICSEIIQARKLDYSEYGSLAKLYKQNPNMFYDYNVIDVYRVEQLDEKMKFIDQVIMMAHMARVNLVDTFGTVRIWEILIHNYLMERGIVPPTSNPNHKLKAIAGAYVKDPVIGKHNAVMSFDWTSLYPSAIMAFNISPEMYRGKFAKLPTDITSVDEILNGAIEEYTETLVKNGATITGKGTVFENTKQGFIPAIMKMLFNQRKAFKRKMLEYEDQMQVLKAEKAKRGSTELFGQLSDVELKAQEEVLSKSIAEFNNKQMAMKILANGGYGALSNEMNIWYSDDIAESVTLSGQLVNRNAERYINRMMNKRLNTTDVDYVLYMDTDSCYLNVELILIAKFGEIPKDNAVTVAYLEEFSKDVDEAITESLQYLYKTLNIQDKCLDMKLEAIGSGVWVAKKRYVMSVLSNEGVHYDPPKIKMQGIDAVRSSTPQVCRGRIKEAIPMIIEGDRNKLKTYIDTFRNEWYQMKFEQVASPRGVSNIDQYYDPKNIYRSGKDGTTPIAARGALLYNNEIKTRGLQNSLEPIRSGDKIRFCYMSMPNPVNENVFALPDQMPVELQDLEKYIDYNLQFEKTFLKPISSIIDAAGIDISDTVDVSAYFVDYVPPTVKQTKFQRRILSPSEIDEALTDHYENGVH